MAKFAPVVPLSIAQVLKREGTLGSYHLLLAHDVLAHPAKYEEIYDEAICPFNDGCVILDNSLIELGTSMTYDGIMEAASIIDPHFVVLPDTLGDCKATVEQSREFYEYAKEKDKLRYIAPMGVVQGKTISECMQCAFQLKDMVQAFCVPRVITKYLGSRTQVTQWLVERFRKSVHLLGFSDDILDDVCTARLTGVIGIDSAAPIRLAITGRSIELSDSRIAQAGPRGAFWETSDSDAARWKFLINENLDIVRGWVEPRKPQPQQEQQAA